MATKEIAGRIKIDLLADNFATPDEYSVAGTGTVTGTCTVRGF